MQTCSRSEFEQLVENAAVLEGGLEGPRVYKLPGQKIVKVFRSKRLLSSNRLVPYALRFKRCAQRLIELGFNSVRVEKMAHCRELDMHFVVYPMLPGLSIRELDERALLQPGVAAQVAAYVASLHRNGVYYKAFHLGNIIVQEDGSFALIDIHSTRFYKSPVSIDRRARNLLNMFRYQQDRNIIDNDGVSHYFGEYLQASGLNAEHQAALIGKLKTSRAFPELKVALDNLTP